VKTQTESPSLIYYYIYHQHRFPITLPFCFDFSSFQTAHKNKSNLIAKKIMNEPRQHFTVFLEKKSVEILQDICTARNGNRSAVFFSSRMVKPYLQVLSSVFGFHEPVSLLFLSGWRWCPQVIGWFHLDGGQCYTRSLISMRDDLSCS